MTKGRIKAKERFEAGRQFNIYDHALDPIKNLLRLKPGDAASSIIEETYEKTEKAYLKEIEKAGESIDSNAYIKDDKGIIHKFKINIKTCVDHTKAKNTNENNPTESQKILTERKVKHSASVRSGVRVDGGNKASRGDVVVRIEMVGCGSKHRRKASPDEEEWSLNPVIEKLVTEKPVMLKEDKGRIVMEKEVMENTVMENIQPRSEQELDDVKITIQSDVHHALEITQENTHNNMNEDTTVVPQMNEDGNSVSHGTTVTEKQDSCV